MPTTEIPAAPSPENPARETHRKFSPEEVRLLAEMMTKPEVNGNLAAAVALLQKDHPATDWGYMRCYKLTRTNAYLNAFSQARNPEALVPQAEDTIDRDNLIGPAERRELEALARQEKQVRAEDWVALGITEQQAGRMLSMEKFARQPLKAMIAVTHGGMMFTFGTLLQNFEDTAKRLAGQLLPDEFDKEGNPRPAIDVERDRHKILLEYSKEIRAIKDQIDRANLLTAKVDQMKGEKGPKQRGRPGFNSMTVNASPGSKVVIEAKPEQQ